MAGDVIAVLNAGSSSVKFSLFSGDDLALITRGQAEGLFTSPHFIAKDSAGAVLDEKSWGDGVELGHAGALDYLMAFVRERYADRRLMGVGHRVVHGGPEFARPTQVDATVLTALAKYIPLAPLHQPHNLAPIRLLHERSPHMPQVACFDTAFHRGQPAVAQAFALPRSITDRGVIRYGFHGLSYEYIAQALPAHDARAAAGNVVVRTLEASAEPGARAAIDLFVYRIGRELGSLAAALGGLDAIVFTAGIGEHSRTLRERVCRDAAWLGVTLDAGANARNDARISAPQSRVPVWVIPTNEELMIARYTRDVLAEPKV